MHAFQGNYLYFKIADTEREIKECQEIRFKVYCNEKKWLHSASYPDGFESDLYDDKSPTFIAKNEESLIVGMMRIIKGSDYGTLPFLKHPEINKDEINLNTLAELSRYIVYSKKYRDIISFGIFRLSHYWCAQNDITDYVILIEPALKRLVERYYYFYEPMCKPAEYFGAVTYPAICNVKQNEEIWYSKYPKVYEFYKKSTDLNVIDIKKFNEFMFGCTD